MLQHRDSLRPIPYEDAERAMRRLAEHYLVQTARAVATTEPGKERHSNIDEPSMTRMHDATTAIAWFREQLPPLRAVFQKSQDRGWDELMVCHADVL